MKKVMHIVESFGGGVFTFLVDLVNALENDYEIVILYSNRPQTPENYKKYFSDKIRFIEVKNLSRNINLIKDLKAFGEIRKIVRKEKPDIIHLHSSKAGFIGRFAANGKKVRMLYNPHGFSFLMQDSSRFKRRIYWLIEKIASFRNCTIVGCSQGEYKEAKKISRNAICINNGINIDKLREETENFEKKKIDFEHLKICTIGRIGFQKNPELFNRIAESLPNIQFTWIGDGELKSKLTAPNILVTGWKERKDVLKILNQSDIFVLTSLWEGLPISLLEAMYMKKLCIVSDCIGNRDVIKNEKNGYIINKDFEEIINCLDEEKISKIVDEAFKDLIEKYTVTNMVNMYKIEYDNLEE